MHNSAMIPANLNFQEQSREQWNPSSLQAKKIYVAATVHLLMKELSGLYLPILFDKFPTSAGIYLKQQI